MEKSLIFEDKFNYGWPKKTIVKTIEKLDSNGVNNINYNILFIIKSICLVLLVIL